MRERERWKYSQTRPISLEVFTAQVVKKLEITGVKIYWVKKPQVISKK